MNSFILTVRNISALAENILKSEAIGLQYYTVRRRTLFASQNRLISVSVHDKKFQQSDVQDYPLCSRTEQNIGKIVDLDVEFDDVKTELDEIPRRKRKVKKESKLTKAHVPFPEQNNEELNYTYAPKTVESKYNERNESLFSSTMLNMKSKKYREKHKNVLIEGKRLIHDAISAGFEPEIIFHTKEVDLQKLNVPDTAKTVRVFYKSCKLWSDVVHPQGVFGVFKMPTITNIKRDDNTIPLTIICDNVREPGNLGSILRIAAGVGCERVFLTKGCVDLWDPKVLRGGAGAHFRFPVLSNMLWSDIEAEVSEDSKIFLAEIEREANRDTSDTNNQISPFKISSEDVKHLPLHCYSSVKYTNTNTVFVIGGETYGVSHSAYEFAAKRNGARVYVPLSNSIESLNNSVTLGILAYEFKRQLNSAEDSNLLSRENAESVNE